MQKTHSFYMMYEACKVLSLVHIRNDVLHSMGNHKLKPFYRVCALELNSTDIDFEEKKKSYFEN